MSALSQCIYLEDRPKYEATAMAEGFVGDNCSLEEIEEILKLMSPNIYNTQSFCTKQSL